MNKHIVIIGLGGVGGYFGFKISQFCETSQQHNISFIARGKTYEVVKTDGLTLLSPEHENQITKPNAVYSTISEIQNPDLLIICVKEYDLENVCRQLLPVITEETVLLPMMNGADIYDRIRSIIPNNVLLPSCVYVASHIKKKGTVEHKGKPGKLFFGRDPQQQSAETDWIVELIANSNIHFDFTENVVSEIWTKFIFIASFGLVSAKHNSSIGAVCHDELQKKEAAQIMQEIKEIADAKHIGLPSDIAERTFQKAATFPPETPTSLQLDVNSGKLNNELELFAGAIIKYGEALGISTANTSKIYEEIKAKINRAIY